MIKEIKREISTLNILKIAGVEAYKEQYNEKYMNEKQYLHFKKILQAWLNKIKKEMKSNIHYKNDEITENLPDPIDRAVQEEEFNLKLLNRDREYRLIQKIELTLKKLENKNFGYCDVCGIEIGIRRLEAQPIASLCIDCKTLAEMREKQRIV